MNKKSKKDKNILKLSFVNLYTKNFKNIINFYHHVLGIKALKGNKGNWFGFKTGETTFAIEPQSNRKNYNFKFNKNNPVLLQFKANTVADLEKITKSLENKRVVITQRMIKKSYGTITTFLDPDGNVVELIAQ